VAGAPSTGIRAILDSTPPNVLRVREWLRARPDRWHRIADVAAGLRLPVPSVREILAWKVGHPVRVRRGKGVKWVGE